MNNNQYAIVLILLFNLLLINNITGQQYEPVIYDKSISDKSTERGEEIDITFKTDYPTRYLVAVLSEAYDYSYALKDDDKYEWWFEDRISVPEVYTNSFSTILFNKKYGRYYTQSVIFPINNQDTNKIESYWRYFYISYYISSESSREHSIIIEGLNPLLRYYLVIGVSATNDIDCAFLDQTEFNTCITENNIESCIPYSTMRVNTPSGTEYSFPMIVMEYYKLPDNTYCQDHKNIIVEKLSFDVSDLPEQTLKPSASDSDDVTFLDRIVSLFIVVIIIITFIWIARKIKSSGNRSVTNWAKNQVKKPFKKRRRR